MPTPQLEAPQPGQFWKTPFIWEPGCREPAPPPAGWVFEPAGDDWLVDAVAQVMADSLDESDRHAVAQRGPPRAATDLLAMAPEYFDWRSPWWCCARDAQGQRVGFVLPVLFRARERWKAGQPQGTIFYMGVLPEFRGRGHGFALLAEATRIFIVARCWRIFCDTATDNHPMLDAFRRAGYQERAPWQRPVA